MAHSIYIRRSGIKRSYLPLCKGAATTFEYPGDDVTTKDLNIYRLAVCCRNSRLVVDEDDLKRVTY